LWENTHQEKIMKRTAFIYAILAICAVAVNILIPHEAVAAVTGDHFSLMFAFGTIGAAANQTVYGTGAYPQRGGADRTSIPIIFSALFNAKFYTATVLNAIANTNYEGLIKAKGDKVVIHQLPDVTITDYEKGDEIVYEDLDKDNIELDIDYAKIFAFKVDDIDKLQSDVNLMDAYGNVAGEQMKVKIDKHVLGVIPTQAAAGNFGATAGKISGDINMGTAAAPLAVDKSNILDVIVDMGTVLDEADIPETGRNLVLPARICGLIKKSEIKNASITGDNVSVMRNGRIGEVDRFTLFSSNNLTVAGGVYDAIGSTRQALTFASQIVKVKYLETLEQSFASAMRGLNVYGFKVENPTAMVVAKLILA
jgi:hypothetical protein